MYPKSMTTHPFKHRPLTCDHVEEFAEIGALAKDGIFLTHCKIFPFEVHLQGFARLQVISKDGEKACI